MLLIDTKERVFARDEELKLAIARKRPLEEWLKELFTLNDLRNAHMSGDVNKPFKRRAVLLEGRSEDDVSKSGRAKVLEDRRLALFAYTTETINLLVLPMVKTESVLSFQTNFSNFNSI
jgi:glutamate synthase (NADPH/NADH)